MTRFTIADRKALRERFPDHDQAVVDGIIADVDRKAANGSVTNHVALAAAWLAKAPMLAQKPKPPASWKRPPSQPEIVWGHRADPEVASRELERVRALLR